MGLDTEIGKTSDTGLRRIIESLPPERKRRMGLVAGAGGSLGLIASLAGNAWQDYRADAKEIRVQATEEHDSKVCEERVSGAWRKYAEHMREAHGL